MPMLSGALRRAAPNAPAAPAVRFAPQEEGIGFELAGVLVLALPEGALWIEAHQTLVVSDLHLEKGSAFARGGAMLPPYDTRATLQAVAGLVARRKPRVLVSLGDSFHDPAGPARLDGADRAQLDALLAACRWIWIEGNHDGAAPERLGGEARSDLRIGPLLLRHEPGGALENGALGEIAGHLHPAARVAGTAGSVRRRCFATDGLRLVMPAMGAFAGGLNVLDRAFAPVFPSGCAALLLSRGKVYPAGWRRLQPD